jgi:hypothetical protein
MAQVITIAGERLFAIKAQNNQPLDIDTFIFANVPGQDSSADIDRNETVPPVGQQVHTQIVQQAGRVNDNVVIYSTVLDSLTGPFDFNWVGLYSSVNQTLVAISHVPNVSKTITVPGAAGNTLNRNFGIEYSGIADLTGITVAPETWQLDYTSRLNGMDELTRQLAADMNGKDWFIGDGFKVVPRSTLNSFKVTAGAGYVSGLRVELAEDHILTLSSYPQFVYVDAWFDGDNNSVWKGQTAFTVTNTEMDDYIDVNGKQHYVFKLANITAADVVEDLRNIQGVAQKLDYMGNKLTAASDFFNGFPSNIPQLGGNGKVGVYVEVANADAGGSIWVFRPSGRAFVAEQLISGSWSAGESLPNSCPAWRFGRVSLCEGLAAYNTAYSATNIGGTMPSVTFTSTLFSGGSTIFKNGVKMWRFTGSGAYIEFTTKESEISLLLGSNSDCSAALKIQLYKSGVYIKDLDLVNCKFGTGYDAFLWSAKNPFAGQTVTIRVTATASATEYVMVGGIDASLNELKYKTADYLAFHINNDADKIISSATGAQNYAIQEEKTGLFGGESHGGEYMARRNVFFDDIMSEMVSGTYSVCSRLSIEQLSQVVWGSFSPAVSLVVKSQIKLTSEGSQFIGDFTPYNLVATTAYFSMFAYQGTFDRVYIPKYVDTSVLNSPVQIQMPQASGFKAANNVGSMVECSWSLIFKNNTKYKPYLQRKPQDNLYDKFYYGLAIPPDNGVKLEPLRFVSVRTYSI